LLVSLVEIYLARLLVMLMAVLQDLRPPVPKILRECP
jgi:hypothetical protein